MTPIWLWVLAIVLLAVNVVLQRPETVSVGEIEDLKTGKKVEPPTGGADIALAKLAIAHEDSKVMGVEIGETILGQFEQFAEQSEYAQEKFRFALVLGRLDREARMEAMLAKLEGTLHAESALRDDAMTLRRIEAGEVVAGAELDEFKKRHAWFADLALDSGQPGGTLKKAEADGEKLTSVGLRYVALQVVLFLAGLGALVTFIALGASGRIRRFPTAWRAVAGEERVMPRVWLETVALFLGGFLVLKLSVALAQAAGAGHDVLIWMTLLAPWALVLAVMWGRFRGLSPRQFREQIGWHAGRGLGREIGTGIAAYVALIPVVIIVTVVLMVIYAILGLKSPQVANRVFELGSGTGWQLFATFALVVAWAPIVEEAVFRGSLYRFVRSRGGILAAAAVSAIAFAVMHAYALPQLVAVGTLGVGFALLREWRGSLVASMTAHFLQNAVVFTFVSQVAPLVGA